MQYDKSLLISMNLKNIKESIKIIFFLIILLFIMHSNRSFYNLYILAKFNIDERLTKSYGYCNNASYGFINEIYNEYSIKENILILNDNPNFSFNNSVWFKYIPNKKLNKKKIILLNNNNSIELVDEKKARLTFKNKKYGIYNILKNKDDCFFLEKHD